jgi:hypothetical protein
VRAKVTGVGSETKKGQCDVIKHFYCPTARFISLWRKAGKVHSVSIVSGRFSEDVPRFCRKINRLKYVVIIRTTCINIIKVCSSSSQTPSCRRRGAPISEHINGLGKLCSRVPTGPETKNYCSGEGHQQITAPVLKKVRIFLYRVHLWIKYDSHNKQRFYFPYRALNYVFIIETRCVFWKVGTKLFKLFAWTPGFKRLKQIINYSVLCL